MQKDRKRYEKIGKDGGCVGECCFHVMLQTRVVLNREFPYLGGPWLVSDLFLGFVSVFVFELSAVYVPIT